MRVCRASTREGDAEDGRRGRAGRAVVAFRGGLPDLSRAASPTATATGSATCAGSSTGSTTSPGWASTWCGSRRSTRRRRTTRLRHQRLRGRRPHVRHARRPRRADRGSCTSAGSSSSWTWWSTTPRDEHPWFVESRSAGAATSATGTGGGRRGRGWSRGSPGAEPNNWGSFFSGLGLGARRGRRRVLPAPVLAQAARPELGEPGGPRGGLRDDAAGGSTAASTASGWTSSTSSRRTPRLPDGPVLGGGPFGDGAACFICGPRIHEFLAEMHREVFAGRPRAHCSRSGRCRA